MLIDIKVDEIQSTIDSTINSLQFWPDFYENGPNIYHFLSHIITLSAKIFSSLVVDLKPHIECVSFINGQRRDRT